MRAALVLAAALAAAPAGAQSLVSASDPEALRAVAATLGEAELGRDGYGDPLIHASAGGIRYIVEFYGCRNGRNCTEVLIRCGFTAEGFDETDMAGWNRAGHHAKAYIDELGGPHLEMDVILAAGTTEANLADTFAVWGHDLDEFVRYIGWGG